MALVTIIVIFCVLSIRSIQLAFIQPLGTAPTRKGMEMLVVQKYACKLLSSASKLFSAKKYVGFSEQPNLQ